MEIKFFLPMKSPPTVTAQEKKISTKNKKPVIYEDDRLKQAKDLLHGLLYRHKPDKPLSGPVRLVVKWLFPITGKYTDGEYKITRPDTDNLNKMLKDCMTRVGYWKDDAQVCSEIIEKFYAEKTGIFIQVEELED